REWVGPDGLTRIGIDFECCDDDPCWYTQAISQGLSAIRRVRAICTSGECNQSSSCCKNVKATCCQEGAFCNPGVAKGSGTPSGTVTFGIVLSGNCQSCPIAQCCPLMTAQKPAAPCCCAKACSCCETCKAKSATSA